MYEFDFTQFSAELVANGLLQDLNIEIPYDLVYVLNELGINYNETSLSEGFDGAVVWTGEVCGIIINSNILHDGRKRFTIAHELGHIYLGHKGNFNCISENIGTFNHRKNKIESQADMFAAEFLMPTKSIKNYIKHIDPSFEAFESIADKYKVSLTAAAIKFLKTDEIPAMLIYLENGIVQWALNSINNYWEVKLKPVDCHVHKMIERNMNSKKGELNSSKWLIDCKYEYLVESSKNFTSLNSQLVLLTIAERSWDDVDENDE